MGEKQTFGYLVDVLKTFLECSQSKIAKLLEFAPNTPSNNREKLLSDLTPNTQQRIIPLYNIVVHYACLGLKTEALFYVLETQVYKDHRGNRDSVLSALRQDKYSYETLQEIAALAYEHYQEKQARQYHEVDVRSYA